LQTAQELDYLVVSAESRQVDGRKSAITFKHGGKFVSCKKHFQIDFTFAHAKAAAIPWLKNRSQNGEVVPEGIYELKIVRRVL
jgi:hypothetical protein